MRVHVDQSGKIEYTSKHTVVAYANGQNKSIYISSSNKQKLLKIFRDAGKPDIFAYKTFAVLIYLLIKDDLKKLQSLIIDREYTRREDLIKKYLIELIRKGGDKFDPHDIHFDEIGKHSAAHAKAINVFRRREKPNLIVVSEDLLKWLI